MAPDIRIRELRAGLSKKKNPKKAGVMALFYPNDDWVAYMLLILRKSYPGVHSNQIGFPGGKIEETDNNILETALRETHEEVGVKPSDIETVKSLSEIYIPPSNFEVQPYIGISTVKQQFVIQESEVEALVEVPVADILDDKKKISQRLSTSYAENIEVPAFNLNGHVVWGATAMILSEVRELLKQVL